MAGFGLISYYIHEVFVRQGVAQSQKKKVVLLGLVWGPSTLDIEALLFKVLQHPKFCRSYVKLDGVGPGDNRPTTD